MRVINLFKFFLQLLVNYLIKLYIMLKRKFLNVEIRDTPTLLYSTNELIMAACHRLAS